MLIDAKIGNKQQHNFFKHFSSIGSSNFGNPKTSNNIIIPKKTAFQRMITTALKIPLFSLFILSFPLKLALFYLNFLITRTVAKAIYSCLFLVHSVVAFCLLQCFYKLHRFRLPPCSLNTKFLLCPLHFW